MNAIVSTAGNSIATLGQAPSVLGERQVRIPTGGKIRSGIKVLTSSAKQNERAGSIYNAGVARGDSYAAIEKCIKEECNLTKAPLVPKNVPYFTVRRADFAIPEIAERIMERYGEEREQGLHLYRFPVIFPVDAWQAVMPHGLKTYTRNELVYWSEYGPDGTRYCKTRASTAAGGKNRRAHRPFGGRPVVLREENGGICDPDRCPQYQARECNLSGSLLFYMPGISGSAAIELPTTSFYSLQQARQKMEMVAFIRGGKISGTFEGKPIFWLAKAQREVSMLDAKSGEPKRVKQWLIELEADIDMTSLFHASEARQAIGSGNQAAHLLEGAPVDPDADHEFDGEDEAPPVETTRPSAPADGDPAPPAPEADPSAPVKAARQEVMTRIEHLGISVDALQAYATQQWGDGWGRSLNALEKARDSLKQAADTPELLEQIKNANVPF